MPLSGHQLQVLGIVESLKSTSVALGGGAALILAGFVDRPTRDLDFFSNELEAIAPFADQLTHSLKEHGSTVEVLRRSPGFVQRVSDGVLIDVAHNYLSADLIETPNGMRCADADIVGGKLEALFTRRVNRDVLDVGQLLDRYTMSELIAFAENRDAGFNVAITIEMTEGNLHDHRQGFDEAAFEAAKAKVLRHLNTAVN